MLLDEREGPTKTVPIKVSADDIEALRALGEIFSETVTEVATRIVQVACANHRATVKDSEQW